MIAIASTDGRVFVLLLVVTAVTASSTTAAVASANQGTDATTAVLPGSAVADRLPTANECDGAAGSDGEIDDREANIVYGYVHGFEDGRLEQWTDGSIRRFGAYGDCTLSIRDGTTRLTGTQLDASTGALRATIDLGRGGAFVLSPDDGSDVSIAVENVGYENNDTVRVVTTDATGSSDQFQLTAPSGRFFDLRLQFTAEDTARLALSEIGVGYPDETDWEPIELSPQNESWTITLESRAYLDEIAVGDRDVDDTEERSEPATDGEESTDGFSGDQFDGSDDDPSGIDTPTNFPNSQTHDGSGRRSAVGLFFGPLLAVWGAAMSKYAYEFSKFGEQLDAIGSSTSANEVEPAGWNVALTRIFGILLSIGGVLWFLDGLVTVL
jgi:hypothetical protein